MKKKNPKGQRKNKIVDLNSTLSILMVNTNGLSTPNKRRRLAEWIKMDSVTCCLWDTL